ncbi:MAG: guanylate kinase [candidate division Zixibacteria bacterium]
MGKAAKKGKIVIISSPSGGGKTTICRKLIRKNRNWQFSVSYTTREKRKGEIHGRQYYFVDREEFIKLREKDFFAESARVHLYYYGTPRKQLEQVVRKGGVILLDVDVKGAASIKKKYPEALSLFIRPPSIRELKKRLKRRGTETRAQMEIRLQNAIKENEKFRQFNYVIVNKNINEAVSAADYMIKSWTVGVTYFGRNNSRTYMVPE